jgi:hypothetical protein
MYDGKSPSRGYKNGGADQSAFRHTHHIFLMDEPASERWIMVSVFLDRTPATHYADKCVKAYRMTSYAEMLSTFQ